MKKNKEVENKLIKYKKYINSYILLTMLLFNTDIYIFKINKININIVRF